MQQVEHEISKRVMERMDLTKDVSDQELLALIQDEICHFGEKQNLPIQKRIDIQRHIYHSLRKLDILEELLDDDSITEIMINGPDTIFIEQNGKIFKTDYQFSSKEKLEDVIQKIVAATNKMANETHPIVDTKLEDGTRINIVLPPIAVDGAMLSIRKFPKNPISMATLLEWNSISEELAIFVKNLVVAKYNIFVSGGTGSGKTTFLNAMAEFIPQNDRVITIEDSTELQLLNVKNIVRLEAREATMEGKLQITIRDLVRTSLRMRPDRIIVGECRGEEALDMLQSFGTGHDGSFSTGHANSARDMISRMETMALMAGEIPLVAIRNQIASGVDIIIHLGRLPNKSRKVLEIQEVIGLVDGEIKLHKIYEFVAGSEKRGGGSWKKVGTLQHQEKMIQAGIKIL